MTFENIVDGKTWKSLDFARVLGLDSPEIQNSTFNMKECTENGNKVLYTYTVPFKNLTWETMNQLGYIKGKAVVIDSAYYDCKIMSGVTDGVYGGEKKNLGQMFI